MDALPPLCAHRLGRAMARQRRQVDERLIQVVYEAGPFNRLVPLFIVRQRVHDFSAVLLAMLQEADYGILRDFVTRMVRYSYDQGRPVVLSHALADGWDAALRELAAVEFAADPALLADTLAMIEMMVAATHALIDAIYSGADLPPA